MHKAALVLALVACANAGGVYLDHHVGATAEQTVRGFGGLSSISHQAKNVNSAFSAASVYKTKVTNNAVLAAPAFAAPVAHAVAAPAYAAPIAHAVAAPAYAAPVAHAVAAPAYAAPVAHAVAAPAYAAPVAHAVAAPAYASPVAHAVAAPAYAAPIARALAPVAKAGLLGVAYSPVVPGVATLNFDGFGVHYGY